MKKRIKNPEEKIFGCILIVGLVFLLLTFVFGICSYREIYFRVVPTLDPYAEDDWSLFKEYDEVSMEVTMLTGEFSNVFYVYEESGEERLIAKKYAIPNIQITNNGLEIVEFMGIHVEDNDLFESYDWISQATFDWWDKGKELAPDISSPVKVNGYISEMTDEEKQHMKEYIMKSWGKTESQAEEMICPYIVRYATYERHYSMNDRARVCLIISLILLGIGFYGTLFTAKLD